jgi:hypothetical protein
MLCWVQTVFQPLQGKPSLDVWWPALKYDSQSQLFKTDPIMQGNEFLKKILLKDNLGILDGRNLNRHPVIRILGIFRPPVARLLGNPPVTLVWLFSSNMEKKFMDEFFECRIQFDTLPDTDDRKIRFDEAILEALNQFTSSSNRNCIDRMESSIIVEDIE